MSVAKLFIAAKKLTFEDRVELAHTLWDEFMDGFQGYKAPPLPKKASPWKALKKRADTELSRGDRIKFAQRLWQNVIKEGYDPEPTPEEIAELERRVEELRKHPERGIPWEQVKAEMKKRFGRE